MSGTAAYIEREQDGADRDRQSPTNAAESAHALLADSRFSRFSLRLRAFPGPLLGAAFTNRRFAFLFFRRHRLPGLFAFLTQLSFVQIPSEPLVSKTAAETGSSDCQCSRDFDRPFPRSHVPWTFVQRIFIRKREATARYITLTRHKWLFR